MKKKLIYGLAGLATILAVGFSISAEDAPTPAELLQLQPKGFKYPSLQQRVVVNGDYLFEDFESVPDDVQKLPDGWKAIATPDLDDDVWNAGTLGKDGKPMNGFPDISMPIFLVTEIHKSRFLMTPGFSVPGFLLRKV